MKYIKKFDTMEEQTAYLAEADIDTYVGYVGETQDVYYDDALPDYKNMYFTIESLEDNNAIYLKASTSYIAKTVSASTDNGTTWTEYTASADGSGTTLATLNAGDKLLVKGENNAYGLEYRTQYNQFNSTGQFDVKGNIMSLISGDSFANDYELTAAYALYGLFNQCTGLISAENLVLPATTLTASCYRRMFAYCTNLATAPSVLPAETLTDSCYESMFVQCTSLTTAPELPATTLARGCYGMMFNYCTSLTTAPELPATTLAESCYAYMLGGCANLNYIKCMATDISANNCTDTFASGVASTGTFVKAASMNDWTIGYKGIPEGWTVQNA